MMLFYCISQAVPMHKITFFLAFFLPSRLLCLSLSYLFPILPYHAKALVLQRMQHLHFFCIFSNKQHKWGNLLVSHLNTTQRQPYGKIYWQKRGQEKKISPHKNSKEKIPFWNSNTWHWKSFLNVHQTSLLNLLFTLQPCNILFSY